MTQRIFFFLVLISAVQLSAQKNIYENRRFDELTENHEVLAIVPFIANLDLEREVPATELKKLAEKEGYAVQNALETYFSQRKKRKKFNVDFQNIEENRGDF